MAVGSPQPAAAPAFDSGDSSFAGSGWRIADVGLGGQTPSPCDFTGQTGAWDAVLGARGAKLQLVLNAIFHLEASPGNVAFADFQTLSSNRAVALAIPIAVGDNYLGYRIVGTLTNLFTEAEAAPGRGFRLVAGGAGSKTAIAKRWWGSSLPNASG